MNPEFGYAQARVQARLAALGDGVTWRRLDATRSLAGLLEESRNSHLSHWVGSMSPMDDVHHLEQLLLRRFLDLIRETRDWVPEPWKAAVAWTAWLGLLPLVAYLLKGGTPPAWVRGFPLLGPALKAADGDLQRALIGAGAANLAADPRMDGLVDRWLSHWRRLWPRCPTRQAARLDALVVLMNRHRDQFEGLHPDRGWLERQRLHDALLHLFRRSALQPAAWFAWLGLAALELERLRGALTVRAAFSVRGDG